MSQTETPDAETTDDPWTKRHALMYRSQLSTHYHRRRERFFSVLDRLTKAIAVIGGSAAMLRLTGGGQTDVAVIAGAVVASTSLLGLVFGYGDLARRHADMAARFKALEASYVKRGNLAWPDLDEMESELLEIERAEPPTLRTLIVVIQNEMAIAEGQPSKVKPVAWWRWAVLHVWA